MPAECRPGEATGICRFVEQILKSTKSFERPVVVFLPEDRATQDFLELLEMPEVAGLIVTPNVFQRLGDSVRIGEIAENGRWRMPLVHARGLLVLSGGRLLNVKRSLQTWRMGVRYVFTLDNLEKVSRIRLRRWAARRLIIMLGSNLLNAANRYLPISSKVYERRLESGLGDLIRNRRSVSKEYFVQRRILLVNNSLAAGGAERQLVNTALALKKEGWDVSIQCNQLDSDEFNFYRSQVDPGIPVRSIQSLLDIAALLEPKQVESLGELMRSTGLSQLTRVLPAWVVDDVVRHAVNLLVRKPSVVHFWQDYTNIVGGLSAVLIGVPKIVLGMRNMAPFRFPYFDPFMAPAYRALANCSSVEFVNNSQAGGLDYADWLGIDHRRIKVILNGVVESELPPLEEVTAWKSLVGLPAGSPVVGSVFRFWPEKDPMLWLQTAAEIAARRPDVLFLLIGAGPMRADIERRAQEIGIGSRLVMPGTLEDPRLAIAAMNVFLLTSLVEGTPNVAIEAQYLGCPVVTTIAGGSAETVEHGKTGWVVTERNPRTLADRVLMILDDDGWRLGAAGLAPELMQKRFGIGRMLRETKAIYGFDR